jgi:hypothetical protein
MLDFRHASTQSPLLTCCAVFLSRIASRTTMSYTPASHERYSAASIRRTPLSACGSCSRSGAIGEQAHAIKRCELSFECLLFVRSPHLKDITLDHLRSVIARRPPRWPPRTGTCGAFAISRVLAKIGAIPEPMEIVRPFVVRADLPEMTEEVHPEWARLCRRWLETSAVSDRNRRESYYLFLNIGRWLAE